MRLTRIFLDEPLRAGSRLQLPAAAAAHVSRVLRLKAGDELTLFDGCGGEYAASVLETRSGMVKVQVETHKPVERESPLDLTLAQSIARGERMDWVVQKATELGVTRIVPLFTERTVVRLDEQQAQKRAAHWRGVAVAACEQCGRNRVPDIVVPQALPQWLNELPAPSPDSRLLLDPSAENSLSGLQPSAGAVLLIGPEGGLSDKEHDAARAHGFLGASIGPRVLRTETAGMAALALLQSRGGDL